MNPLIILGACAACAIAFKGRTPEHDEVGGFGPWSGGHKYPVARGGQRRHRGGQYPVQQDFRSRMRRPPPTIPYQPQYFGGQTIQMTNNQMRMLHRDGRVVVDGILIEFVQTRLDGFGQVQARVCVTAYDATNTAVSTRCYWDGGHTINIQERDPYNPSRLDGFGAPLTTAQRHKLKNWQFGLPKQRKYPLYDAEGFSRGHAIAAKGRALTALRGGYINKRQYNQIIHKADRGLREHGDR